MSETFVDVSEAGDLEQQIEAKKAELARLRKAAKQRETFKQQGPVVADWLFGSRAIADELNKLIVGEPWTPEKVQQDFRRKKFPPGVMWKFGIRTLVASRRALRNLPALLSETQAEKTAAITDPE
jgi:hypothetical protein